MYILGYALLAVISGWIAWRRNPMFSVRSTLRFLLAVGLMLAAVIGAIVAAVNFGSHHSQTAAFSAIGAVIVFGTAGLIWVIMAVSNPREAPLPASVKMLHVYRGKVWVWGKRFGSTVLVLGLLELVLRGTAQVLVGVFSSLYVFLGVIMLFAGYLSARQSDRWLSEVEADPWVHWSYSAEQWRQWTDVEVARAPATPTFLWRRDWRKIAWPVLAIGIGVAAFSPGSWLYRGLYVAGVTLFLVLLIVLGQRSDKTAPQRVRKTLMKADPEVYFGQDGIFADGTFTPWLTISNYLLAASVDERAPRSVLLQFEKVVAGNAGNQMVAVNVCVPLPDGSVAGDLARLQKELSARCSSATVTLA